MQQAVHGENIYLQPSRVNVLGRKDSNISAAVSEGDSLIDMYETTAVSNGGLGSMEHRDRKRVNGEIFDDDDLENSRWIHRDKLARIESRELQEAGIHFGQQSRTGSRQTRRRSRSRERQTNGGASTEQQPYPTTLTTPPQRKRELTSPASANNEDDEPITNFDLRLPEEALADPHEDGRIYKTPIAKQSFSRIPLSTSSPIPVPQDYIARHTPLQRSGSNGWSGEDEGFAYGKTRSRSQSIGSQVLLDDEEHYSPSPSSPGKSRQGSRIASSARKMSANRSQGGQQKSHSRPGQARDNNSRPGTRSGETPPGSSSKRPEGDPPWLAHMYKPDPRLPPDQQLLPTVAKRLKQEQWQREGKVGSVYDREFNLLEETPPSSADNNPKAQPAQKEGNGNDPSALGWPLQSPKSPGSPGRPDTSGTDHGGYRTMPKVQSTPASAPISGTKTLQPIRLQEPLEEAADEKGKKKGFCCSVM